MLQGSHLGNAAPDRQAVRHQYVRRSTSVGGTPVALSTSNPFGLLGNALSDLSGGQVGQVCGLSNASAAAAVGNTTVGPSSVQNPLSVFTSGGSCFVQNNIQGRLKALETVGLLHTLAEPNLTAVSGETAKFLAGGEFPVPAGRDQQGNVSITFKQFGVGLSFTPVVLSGGPHQPADFHRSERTHQHRRLHPDGRQW